MGILSSAIARAWAAIPFQSDPLDRLAEKMQVGPILKRNKMQRYYMVPSLQARCLSYPDAVFFDAEYYNMLVLDEILAVGAHEFNHIREKHGERRFARVFLPALAISVGVGVAAFVNFDFFATITLFRNSGEIMSGIFLAAMSLLPLSFACYWLNASWNRKTETQSDLATVRFSNGESMISALVKLRNLSLHKPRSLGSRLMPRTYPTIDERIHGIRVAMEEKDSSSLSHAREGVC